MYDQEVNTFESYLHMKYGMCVCVKHVQWLNNFHCGRSFRKADHFLSKQIN